MRNQIKTLFFVALIGLFYSACTKTQSSEVTQEEKTKKETMAEKVLRHVVIFKFKDDAPEAEVEKINQSFNALKDSIPVIKDFEWGLNDSPEDLHQGFTHCYLLTFASEEDRDSVYTPHPAHKAFVASLQPHLEKVFVVDYWTK